MIQPVSVSPPLTSKTSCPSSTLTHNTKSLGGLPVEFRKIGSQLMGLSHFEGIVIIIVHFHFYSLISLLFFYSPAIVCCCVYDICYNILSCTCVFFSRHRVLFVFTSYVSSVRVPLTSCSRVPIQDVRAAAVDTPGRHGAPGADGAGGRRRESGETR